MNEMSQNTENGNIWVQQIKEWLMGQGVQIILNLLTALLIFFVGFYLIRFICHSLDKILKKSPRVDDMLKDLMVSVVGKSLWVLVIIMILGRLGLDIGPLLAGLGLTGFILGFAFQDSLSNLASGVMLTLNRPFQIGDYVDAGGVSGTIKSMDMMVVSIITPDNKQIIIPNKSVWGSAITNYTALDTRRVDMAVGISYGSDIAKAKQVILEAVLSFDEVLSDPAPIIEVVGLGDSSVKLVVRPWVKTADYWTILFAAYPKIKSALDANGIEIPFPQLDVHHIGRDTKNASVF
jgi:small conductance mechanosensitive channel